jgi:two-component system chemotaxis response regulator CheV
MGTTNINDSLHNETRIAGENRIEMLLFRLANFDQLYGINVFKVREVLPCPRLTVIPNSSAAIKGIANFRGKAIPIIDFSFAIGNEAVTDVTNSLVIISEYNNKSQAFVVSSIEKIIDLCWYDLKLPPVGAGSNVGSYLTAVTEVDNKLVEIIDIERILQEVQPYAQDISQKVLEECTDLKGGNKKIVIIADDSAIARNQIQRCMNQINVKCVALSNGKQALDFLLEMVNSGRDVSKEVVMLISDVEMPIMDGYTLTTEIRFNPKLKDLHVILHTSLSGSFNEMLVKKVGANNFITKFHPDLLAKEVKKALKK